MSDIKKENYITDVDILDEAKECFLTYAEEVLTDRAIPSVEDGLLSVQRKILWTMNQVLKMNNKSQTKKSASIVGSTLASAYIHGDASCYGALCKLAQPFLMRYPLIAGQGSLGTQEANNMQAAARYTEAKPSLYADLMFNDYKKNVIPTKETYNGEYQEPVFLPALFPNALVNGREAIGVSLSHNSLPHNLTEVCNAIIHYIQKNGNLTIDDIIKDMPGPDFPLGGEIVNSSDIRTAFSTGKSTISLKVRGDYEIKNNQIIFTSIPYRTYRSNIKEQINKNIDVLENYFSDFNDESNIGENKLVFTLRRDINPQEALNKLFAFTDLQTTLSYNMNFIINGTPKLCSIKDLIDAYYKHQINVILNATQYDLKEAQHKLHILEGLYIACQNIQQVIDIIRGANDRMSAQTQLIVSLHISEEQAKAILDMKLARLTKLDTNEIKVDIDTQKNIISKCLNIINNKQTRDQYLIDLIIAMQKQYGDARRTKLNNYTVEQIGQTTKSNALKQNIKYYVTENKNNTLTFNTSSSKTAAYQINSIDLLCAFTSFGNMHKIIVNNLIKQAKTTKAINLSNYLKLETGEEIKYICPITDLVKNKLIVITQKGYYKEIDTEELNSATIRQGKVKYYGKLKENDYILEVKEIKKRINKITCILNNKQEIEIAVDKIPKSKKTALGKSLSLKENYIIKVKS